MAGGHRRPRHSRASRSRRDAARAAGASAGSARRTAWRTSWCRRAASPSTRSPSPACAARACCTRCSGGAAAAAAPSGSCSRLVRRAARRGARHGRLRLLPRRLDGLLLGKPLVLVNADAVAAAEQQGAAAGGRPRRLRLRRRGGDATTKARSSPATRCAPRSRRCPSRRERFAGRSGPLRLLVVGGSLGARVLNDMRAAGAGADRRRRSGRASRTRPAQADRRACSAAYAAAGVEAEVLPFIDDMAQRARRLRPDRLPRRRDHRQRALRRRRRRGAGAADRQHHLAPARQRRVAGRRTARRSTCRRPS